MELEVLVTWSRDFATGPPRQGRSVQFTYFFQKKENETVLCVQYFKMGKTVPFYKTEEISLIKSEQIMTIIF